jgi:putative FmdB family regulatory protein|tara:strand:- start:1782 stop:2045 length:264 start_codon:yes stop_codon:yes gene_type:complete
MPTYVYKCNDCEHLFEAIHSYKERLTDCPECKEEKTLKKQFNTPIHLIKHTHTGENKPGELVKQEIERNKEEIKKFDEKRKKENNKQ